MYIGGFIYYIHKYNKGRNSAEAALQNKQKDEKKGPHHSMNPYIY